MSLKSASVFNYRPRSFLGYITDRFIPPIYAVVSLKPRNTKACKSEKISSRPSAKEKCYVSEMNISSGETGDCGFYLKVKCDSYDTNEVV